MRLGEADQEQLWAEAKRRCRLSDEVLRMAKELGLSPRSLIKNIPSSSEPWKAPVQDWVRDICEKRHGGGTRRQPCSSGATPPQVERKP